MLLLALIGFAGESHGQGTFAVRFSKPIYTVAPGGTIPLDIVIDPAPAAGVFSYGVSVGFDPAQALLTALGITVPPDLNFNGVLGPGAETSAGSGFAAVKGTIDFSAVPMQIYHGSLLAHFTLTDRSTASGASYPLTLDFFRTLGAGETIFVDGSGQSLDGKVVFGMAMVSVVPEPTPFQLGLLMIGLVIWFSLLDRKRPMGAFDPFSRKIRVICR